MGGRVVARLRSRQWDVLVRAAALWGAAVATPAADASLHAQRPRSNQPDARATSVAAAYSGVARRVHVIVPRLEMSVVADGILNDSAWTQAAVLSGFSEYAPVDGTPAEDSSEVLVFYSANAIHFGVKAWESHGPVHAALPQRDHIEADDFVQVILDPFLDGRRAFVFAVNPHGIQADGICSEENLDRQGGSDAYCAGSNTITDLSPDFRFQSKGRLTSWGYEAEIIIPFSSLRYPPGSHHWGLQIVRRVQHSGHLQTWTPALRARASFLAQSGTLEGLAGLHRGLVLEAYPEGTARETGDTAGGWHRTTQANVGGSGRWALTPSFTLNATVRPDFSQVEADATQLAPDPRFPVYYAEKRPFFTDASEEFETPSQLVYTRRIVEPVWAGKLTGRLGGVALAAISTLDACPVGDPCRRRSFAVFRARGRPAASTTLGWTVTDMQTDGDFNRVASADARTDFGQLYYVQFQLAGSLSPMRGHARAAPLWHAILDRSGQRFGFHYQVTGIDSGFRAAAGFVPRSDFVQLGVGNRVTPIIAPGAVLETWVVRPTLSATWLYRDFFASRRVLEQHADVESAFNFRGGWFVSVSPVVERYAFDPRTYRDYAVERRDGLRTDTLPVGTPAPVPVMGTVAQLQTPQLLHGSASLFVFHGRDVDFVEAAQGHRTIVSVTTDLRPNAQLRLGATYQRDQFHRLADRSTSYVRQVPRLKIEYQLTPAVLVRIVGQYEAQWRDALQDPRTRQTILLVGPNGYARSEPTTSNAFRVDWLAAYQPAPGTAVFLGYGSGFTEPNALTFRQLRRTADGVFVKLSYLLHS